MKYHDISITFSMKIIIVKTYNTNLLAVADPFQKWCHDPKKTLHSSQSHQQIRNKVWHLTRIYVGNGCQIYWNISLSYVSKQSKPFFYFHQTILN